MPLQMNPLLPAYLLLQPDAAAAHKTAFQNKPKDCADRDQCLRGYDARSAIRFSHENKAVQTLYDEYLEAPLSDRAHHLLHVEEY